MSELAEFKQRTRAIWAAGDFATVAQRIWGVGGGIVRRTSVGPGDDVLDVGCGTGNAAVQAAAAGGRVVGVDLTPELFEDGRRAAAAAGVEVEWVEGDAEALPFPDESFDVVVSTFGCMFAPRHALAASELARVLRPGGRLGVCSWTPEGTVGAFFRTMAEHTPPPPPFAEPPLLWGDEGHVREIVAGTGVDLEFQRDAVLFEFESPEAATEWYETNFGPIVMARALLEPQGKWAQLRADLVELFDRNRPSDGPEVAMESEYLVALGRKRGAGGG